MNDLRKEDRKNEQEYADMFEPKHMSALSGGKLLKPVIKFKFFKWWIMLLILKEYD